VTAPLRVLLVEDSADDASIVERELRQDAADAIVHRVETEAEMRSALEQQPWDIVLCDYALPGFGAERALGLMQELTLDVPAIIVSGKVGEETAVALMKAGASDYIMKDNLSRLNPAVRREVRDAQVRRERRRLERELLEIAEHERRAFGRDLHDGPCQLLTAAAYLAKMLGDGLEARGAPEAAQAAKIQETVAQALRETHSLARGLCPMGLGGGGLAAALRALAADAEGLFDISCDCSGWTAEVHDEVAAAHVYRIVQEALSNAVKHGKARHVRIALWAEGGTTRLEVEDDGGGMPGDAPDRGGMGLRVMRYRATVIGGTFATHPSPSGGTTVSCSFPTSLLEGCADAERRHSAPRRRAEASCGLGPHGAGSDSEEA